MSHDDLEWDGHEDYATYLERWRGTMAARAMMEEDARGLRAAGWVLGSIALLLCAIGMLIVRGMVP
jgi:hypothetical protein